MFVGLFTKCEVPCVVSLSSTWHHNWVKVIYSIVHPIYVTFISYWFPHNNFIIFSDCFLFSETFTKLNSVSILFVMMKNWKIFFFLIDWSPLTDNSCKNFWTVITICFIFLERYLRVQEKSAISGTSKKGIKRLVAFSLKTISVIVLKILYL